MHPDALAQFLEENAKASRTQCTSYVIAGVGIVSITVSFEPLWDEDDEL